MQLYNSKCEGCNVSVVQCVCVCTYVHVCVCVCVPVCLPACQGLNVLIIVSLNKINDLTLLQYSTPIMNHILTGNQQHSQIHIIPN